MSFSIFDNPPSPRLELSHALSLSIAIIFFPLSLWFSPRRNRPAPTAEECCIIVACCVLNEWKKSERNHRREAYKRVRGAICGGAPVIDGWRAGHPAAQGSALEGLSSIVNAQQQRKKKKYDGINQKVKRGEGMKSENGEPGKQPFCFLRYDCYFFRLLLSSSPPSQTKWKYISIHAHTVKLLSTRCLPLNEIRE